MRGTNILSKVTIQLKNYIIFSFLETIERQFEIDNSLSYLENLNASLDVCATPVVNSRNLKELPILESRVE